MLQGVIILPITVDASAILAFNKSTLAYPNRTLVVAVGVFSSLGLLLAYRTIEPVEIKDAEIVSVTLRTRRRVLRHLMQFCRPLLIPVGGTGGQYSTWYTGRQRKSAEGSVG